LTDRIADNAEAGLTLQSVHAPSEPTAKSRLRDALRLRSLFATVHQY